MAERKTKEKKQEEVSKKLGDLLLAAQMAHIEDLPHSMKRIDDFIITVAVENSIGNYVKEGSELDWQDPEKYGMQHFEVIIIDRDDKKFVPYLDVKVRIFDNNHALVTETEAPFMWHPFVSHYGFDVSIPDDGEYYAEVTIKSPEFARMHKSHGKKYSENITVKMAGFEIMLPGGEEEIKY